MQLSPPVSMPRASQILRSRPTVQAASAEEAHATIARLFCEHRLDPVRGREVRMHLRSAHTGGVGIEMLDYGAPVRISPVGLESFHLVQIPLAGRAQMQVGNAHVHSSPAVATVPPIDRDFSMRWDAGAPHLIVYVRRDQLLAMGTRVYGDVEAGGLRLAPLLRLDTDAGQSFLRAVFELHDALQLTSASGVYARSLAAETVVARLLLAVETTVSRSLDVWTMPASSASQRSIHTYRRLVEWAEGEDPAALSALAGADAVGVPLRTLQAHVRAASGTTPTAILRDVRFTRARRLLADADPESTTVTAIAERCGFAHLGRFSVEYRQRFGEAPAATLRTA